MNERMSDTSKAMLAYVAANPGCVFETLCAVFHPAIASSSGSTVEKFRARLSYLVSVGYLERISIGSARCYKPGTGLPLAKPTKPAASVATKCDEPLLQPTPPAQYDRMNGPAFAYTMPAPTRPGALDHMRLTSVGDRC